MNVNEITDKNIWEDFLAECKEKTFLQSWNWGKFQQAQGNKIWRLGVFEQEKLTSIALAVKISAKRGTFLLIQHLTGIQNINLKTQEDNSEFKTLVGELVKISKQEKCDFIRIAPLWEKSLENIAIFRKLGFREAPMHANAYEATWQLDISLPEEELLKNMRKTTRYLIKQTLKNPDIKIEKSQKLSNADIYQKLNREVAKRQKFTVFSDKYIKNEFDLFSRDDQALWFFGKYQEEIVAAALIVFWQGTAFYHQAASLSKYAKLSIPYLLQWEAVREAKKRGCVIYDFWGYTDPKKHPKHPWAGPTLFKMGFGGYNKEYLKTQDLPLSKKYWLIYFFEKARQIKRGL